MTSPNKSERKPHFTVVFKKVTVRHMVTPGDMYFCDECWTFVRDATECVPLVEVEIEK